MLEQALNITEAGVLVYDVRDAKSLQLVLGIAEFVKEYLDKINYPLLTNLNKRHPRRREFPLILVGNKSDVEGAERAVTWAEGGKAANKMTSCFGGAEGLVPPQGMMGQSAIPFVEVSAKTGENVEVVFPRLARDVLKSRWQVRELQGGRLLREGAVGLQVNTGTGTGTGGYGKGSLYSSEGGRKGGFWRWVRGCFW